MKPKTLSFFIAFSFILASCDVPENYKNLLLKDTHVAKYESFSELTSLTPVPCRMELGFFDILVLIFQKIFTTPTLTYSCLSPSSAKPIEQKVMDFFSNSSLKNTLKLVGYSRQLSAGHPYRINPIVPFFANAGTNDIFNELKVGPASLAPEILTPSGYVATEVTFLSNGKTPETITFDMPLSIFPPSGAVLLFDSDLFPLESILKDNEQNILSDIIIHELTHVWHQELYSKEKMSKIHVLSNQSDTGHDVPYITNPTTSMMEGLAIAAEAIYGSVTSQMINMTENQRRQFFGNTNSIEEELSFLINRQIYVRKNSFLYNLYDYQDCKLREHNKSMPEEESFTGPVTSEWIKDRFYSTNGLVSPDFIAANCPMTTPARLASSEGFIATLFYHLLASSALLPETSEVQKSFAPQTLEEFIKKNARRNYDGFLNQVNEEQLILKSAENPLKKEQYQSDIKNFLLSFRELVLAIKESQPTTTFELLAHLLTSDQLSSFTKEKLAYEILFVSRGQLSSDANLKMLFSDPSAAIKRPDELASAIKLLAGNNESVKTIALMNHVPPIWVEYASPMRGNQNRRINVNAAHHVDLVDIFGVSNKEIAIMARRLGTGGFWRTPQDFINDASLIGKADYAREMIIRATESIKELSSLIPALRLKALTHSPKLKKELESRSKK